ncbi:MAG: hypothetical protein KDA24_22415 [Deltaproteobacteria bacterium]|nr:hypothetical protein [Deltaproteobacteria bacterium]
MRLALLFGGACLAPALLLGGCPKRTSAPDALPDPNERAPQLGSLVDRWSDLDLSLYADLVAAPAAGAPLRALALRHDVDRYTTTLVTWGPPSRAVVQVQDTSAVDRDRGSVGAWVIVEGPLDVLDPEPLDLEALYYGEASRWTVGSVLLRDWADPARGEDPFDVMLAATAQLPAPWVVCRPRTAEEVVIEAPKEADITEMAHAMDPVVLYAYDQERGTRVGLKARSRGDAVPASGSGPFDWMIDHVEFSPAERPASDQWAALGYADCVEIGRVLTDERAKRPRRPLGPPS